jgi:argininosuccinate lyase
MANEPFDLSQDDTHEARLRREAAATGIVDGRKLRKGSRNEQVAIKTTALKRSQLQRLALRAQKSQVEVIEEALDLYERELNKSSGKFGTSQ